MPGTGLGLPCLKSSVFLALGCPPCAPVGVVLRSITCSFIGLFPLYHVCGDGLFYCFVIVLFLSKSLFVNKQILHLKKLSFSGDARSPLQ
jgi:hypothetical protein